MFQRIGLAAFEIDIAPTCHVGDIYARQTFAAVKRKRADCIYTVGNCHAYQLAVIFKSSCGDSGDVFAVVFRGNDKGSARVVLLYSCNSIRIVGIELIYQSVGVAVFAYRADAVFKIVLGFAIHNVVRTSRRIPMVFAVV